MPVTNLNEIDIYYEVHGEGDPVVLLHHGFGSGKIWEKIYPNFIENDHKVVIYDRRGYGRSQNGEDFFKFFSSNRFRSESVEELAVLTEFLGIDQFHIVGQCEGGVIGADYAARYPDQVRTLVLGGTQCFSEKPMNDWNKLVFPQKFSELDEDFRSKMTYWHGAQKGEEFYNKGIELGGGAYGTGIFDLRNVLPQIKCQVLVLYPDRSALFGVEQAVAHYRHLLQGELAVIPHCGHHTYDQKPEEYCQQILAFWDRYYS